MRLMNYALLLPVLAFVVMLGIAYLVLARRASGLPEVTVSFGETRVRAELAVGMVDRARGLSYRDELPEGSGMLFLMGRASRTSFWMQGMRFPIDIVWLREGAVVDVTPEVAPQDGVVANLLRTYAPQEPADEVLELPAGYAAAHGIVIGSRMIVTKD